MHARIDGGKVRLLTRTGVNCSHRYRRTIEALGVLKVVPRFWEHACKLALEGVISKRIDHPYALGNRWIWVKSKCLNREEFIVVGWTDPEGSRDHIGALLLLGYYTEDGRLHYAGRAETGMTGKELKRLSEVLTRIQVMRMPLAESPPRDSRCLALGALSSPGVVEVLRSGLHHLDRHLGAPLSASPHRIALRSLPVGSASAAS